MTIGPKRVLVVAAEADAREALAMRVQDAACHAVVVSSAEEALVLGPSVFACSVVDVDGDRTVVRRFAELRPHLDTGPVVAIADAGLADQLRDDGADYVLIRPVADGELEGVLRDAASLPIWNGPSRSTPDEGASRLEVEVGLWQSPRMQEIRTVIEQAAGIDITVLVVGETGTGKDVVARAIHHLSERSGKPFVKVNCAAVPRELLESELFGHERGAFTGAHQLKIGKFEAANRGTIFLDEIGDLHPALQAKLLHVLQDGEFPRVGGKSSIKIDVRVIAATNQNLEAAVAGGRFREDLYYRLNVIQIEVPPLRERIEEIPALVDYFVQRYSRLYKRGRFRISPRAYERLLHHNYQGNVRELENVVKRMIVLNDPFLSRTTLPRSKGELKAFGDGNGEALEYRSVSLREIVREAATAAERRAIGDVLEQTRWNRVKAAKLLKISYRALLYKIKLVGLEPKRISPMGPSA